MKMQARTVEYSGTSYEIGYQVGSEISSVPKLKALHTNGMSGFGEEEAKRASEVFDRWCPGLSDELRGCGDALKIPVSRLFYYGMTYLLPRCSHIALSPAMTGCGHTLLARNYEFSHEAEDFCLVKTEVNGKYAHMGTSAVFFGRDDGFNDQGLAVTMSSCGFPVGPMPYMRAPKLEGLQFWAVIRALLENCKDVEEALAYLKDMPTAYNLNLLLADKAGHIALVETLDGLQAVRRLEECAGRRYLSATNHPVLRELIPHEPQAMRHSVMRYDWIRGKLEGAADVPAEFLKEMLLSEFPEGLACHYFEDYFGTTKSMVIDPEAGTIELCWGGSLSNGWNSYSIAAPLKPSISEIELRSERFDPRMAEYVPLEASGGM